MSFLPPIRSRVNSGRNPSYSCLCYWNSPPYRSSTPFTFWRQSVQGLSFGSQPKFQPARGWQTGSVGMTEEWNRGDNRGESKWKMTIGDWIPAYTGMTVGEEGEMGRVQSGFGGAKTRLPSYLLLLPAISLLVFGITDIIILFTFIGLWLASWRRLRLILHHRLTDFLHFGR